MGIDHEIAAIAGRQHGLVGHDQLRAIGVERASISYRVAIGRLERLEPRLYRLAGVPETWEQRVLGACRSVGDGTVACRRTAATIWGLWNADAPVEIAVPRSRGPKWVSAKVFRSTDIIGGHRTVHRGIPVTTVPRTLVDLGAVARPWQVEDTVDRALVRELTTTRELHEMLENVARRGRRGVGPLRRALEDVVNGVESVLEAKLVRLVLRSSLPRPEIQLRVPIGPHDTARLDMAYPAIKLAIEADGREAHLTRETFARERERQNELERSGWSFLRFTWWHVTKRPTYVLSSIRSRFLTCS